MAENSRLRLSSLIKPLDAIEVATTAVNKILPKGADGPLDWVQQVEKRELQLGDHVYAWKLGFTYNHHGVVVHVSECEQPECLHDRPSCCGIVHFQPPSGDSPGRIELVSLADFVQGRGVCRCRYGVPSAEFYLRRAGSCSTHGADPWPLTIIRALSVAEVGDENGPSEAQVEYNFLNKNNELLARWCKLGSVSGVQRFYSKETAFSPQTAPARFARLGLATALVGGAAAAAVAAAGSATATASAAAAAGSASASAAGAETTAAAGGIAAGVAGTAATRLASGTTAAGQIARTAALDLLVDIARRPQKAADVMSGMLQGISATGDAPRRSGDEQFQQQCEQNETLTASFRLCLEQLSVKIPKPLQPVLADPGGSRFLCEILVDILEEATPREPRGCAAIIQSFLDDLQI